MLGRLDLGNPFVLAKGYKCRIGLHKIMRVPDLGSDTFATSGERNLIIISV